MGTKAYVTVKLMEDGNVAVEAQVPDRVTALGLLAQAQHLLAAQPQKASERPPTLLVPRVGLPYRNGD